MRLFMKARFCGSRLGCGVKALAWGFLCFSRDERLLCNNHISLYRTRNVRCPMSIPLSLTLRIRSPHFTIIFNPSTAIIDLHPLQLNLSSFTRPEITFQQHFDTCRAFPLLSPSHRHWRLFMKSLIFFFVFWLSYDMRIKSVFLSFFLSCWVLALSHSLSHSLARFGTRFCAFEAKKNIFLPLLTHFFSSIIY